MTRKFNYGHKQYQYTLMLQKRKALSLTVQPNMKIILKAPSGVTQERIDIFLKRKCMWLNKQLNFFKKYQKIIYKREYISGESFLYLGRQYKLVVKKGDKNKMSLSKGVLRLTTTKKTNNKQYNKKILKEWYNHRTEVVFDRRYKEILNNFNYKFVPKLVVRKMKKRWGSFLTEKQVILNPRLVQVSTDCVDYVITHELCHMKYKKHNNQFYSLLNSKYPNWEKVKEELELKIG